MSGDTLSSTRFLEESARLLADVHLERLGRALERLPAEDLFWRPVPDVIAFGTILLHLEGNVRAWILATIGGIPFQRDRDAEFAAEEAPAGTDGPVLLRALEATVREAATILRKLDEGRLLSLAEFQTGEQDHLQAIYHVVEHFAYHTGQAVWISKMRGAPAG